MLDAVSVNRSKSFGENEIKKAVYKTLDQLNFRPPKIPENITVKLNLCYYWDYSTGETTDKRVVSSLIDFFRERWNDKVSISLVESDASAVRANHAFRMLGYEELARNKGVQLTNLSEEAYRDVSVSSGNNMYNFRVPETISKADIFVSIPKPKYHGLTRISCALKNQFGCNPEWKKNVYHPKLDEVIVALNKIMKPHLVLADGLVMNIDKPRKIGLLLAGTNPVSVDFVVAKMMGVDPFKVGHIRLAMAEGIGEAQNPRVVCEDFDVLIREMQELAKAHARAEPRIRGRIKLSLLNTYLKIVKDVPLF